MLSPPAIRAWHVPKHNVSMKKTTGAFMAPVVFLISTHAILAGLSPKRPRLAPGPLHG